MRSGSPVNALGFSVHRTSPQSWNRYAYTRGDPGRNCGDTNAQRRAITYEDGADSLRRRNLFGSPPTIRNKLHSSSRSLAPLRELALPARQLKAVVGAIGNAVEACVVVPASLSFVGGTEVFVNFGVTVEAAKANKNPLIVRFHRDSDNLKDPIPHVIFD